MADTYIIPRILLKKMTIDFYRFYFFIYIFGIGLKIILIALQIGSFEKTKEFTLFI